MSCGGGNTFPAYSSTPGCSGQHTGYSNMHGCSNSFFTFKHLPLLAGWYIFLFFSVQSLRLTECIGGWGAGGEENLRATEDVQCSTDHEPSRQGICCRFSVIRQGNCWRRPIGLFFFLREKKEGTEDYSVYIATSRIERDGREPIYLYDITL